MPRRADTDTLLCPCDTCNHHPHGPQFQSKRTVRSHLARDKRPTYRPARALNLPLLGSSSPPTPDPPSDIELPPFLDNLDSRNGSPALEDYFGSPYSPINIDTSLRSPSSRSSVCAPPGDDDSEQPAPDDDSQASDLGGIGSLTERRRREEEEPSRADSPEPDPESETLLETREHLFDAPHDDELDSDFLPSLAPAFSEHPAIRNTYIRVFVMCSLQGGTWEMAAQSLEGQKAMLSTLVESTPNLEIPGLKSMALTLPTVERRLGVDPNIYIRYYMLCDKCWFRHHPSQLYKIPSHCTVDGCSGSIWTLRPTARNPKQRTPNKIFPYAPLHRTLQRMLQRPGKYKSWQHWRNAGDEPGKAAPLRPPDDPWDSFSSPHARISDVYDGWAWRTIQAGLQRRRGGKWGVEDVDVHKLDQRFVSLPCGLVFQANADWFQASKGSKHSVDALYLTIYNNHRSVRFLREETILVAVFPGPTEPSLEELNYLLEPFSQDMLKLYDGVYLDVHGHDNPEIVHGTLANNCSDLPASRKTGGLRSHNSKYFMCTLCYALFGSLGDPDTYECAKCRKREDWRFLKYSFKARDATADERNQIAETRGKQWSTLDLFPGWMPGRDNLIEYMHAVFLNITRHIIREILFKGGMFTRQHRSKESPVTRFEDLIAKIWWPSTVGRLSKTILQGSTLKADQLRNVIAILPVALWHAWNVNGMIPNTDAPEAKKNTKAAQAQEHAARLMNKRRNQTNIEHDESDADTPLPMRRNYRRHYNAVLQFCVANRIYSSCSTSPYELRRAAECYSRACQEWTHLCCHMTPYFHFCIHLEAQFLRIGPSYSAWVFAYERNNGFLGKFKHNHHAGGELEGTMMRGWVKSQLVQDLIVRMENLPEHTTDDKSVLRALNAAIKGDTDGKRKRGTLLNMLAAMAAEANKDAMQFSRHPAILDLHAVGLYPLVLEHLKRKLDPVLGLVADSGIYPNPRAERFNGRIVDSYSHVTISNLRYGSGNYRRGKGTCFAYIDGRVPVRIEYILNICHKRRDDNAPMITVACAVVSRFSHSDDIPDLDWALWSNDLGIDTWLANTFEAPEVIELSRFSGHMAIAPLEVAGMDIWVTISLDHGSEEPVRPDEDEADE